MHVRTHGQFIELRKGRYGQELIARWPKSSRTIPATLRDQLGDECAKTVETDITKMFIQGYSPNREALKRECPSTKDFVDLATHWCWAIRANQLDRTQTIEMVVAFVRIRKTLAKCGIAIPKASKCISKNHAA
jgi:hypothetical protein